MARREPEVTTRGKRTALCRRRSTIHGRSPRASRRLCQGILNRLVPAAHGCGRNPIGPSTVSDTHAVPDATSWARDAGGVRAVYAQRGPYTASWGRLSDVSVTAATRHRRGEGTGKNPCDRAKSGWKWSVATDANGIAVGWATDGANRHDSILFEPTLEAVSDRGLLFDVETLHLDRGYDSKGVRAFCEAVGITDVICAKKRPRGQANHTKLPTPLGMRWTVERTRACSRKVTLM